MTPIVLDLLHIKIKVLIPRIVMVILHMWSQSHSWMTGTSGLRTECITLDLQTYHYAMNCPMKIFYVQTNLANIRPKMILVRHLTWQMKTVIFSRKVNQKFVLVGGAVIESLPNSLILHLFISTAFLIQILPIYLVFISVLKPL